MNVVVLLVSLVISIFLGVQLFSFYSSNAQLSRKLDSLNGEAGDLTKENDLLKADLSYYAEPENLAKELRAKFDYKKPGEKLIKIQ